MAFTSGRAGNLAPNVRRRQGVAWMKVRRRLVPEEKLLDAEYEQAEHGQHAHEQ